MYVIFPADELIYMTYGAAVPRLQPRPTLDNLREPLVPLGNRPSPSRNPLLENPTQSNQLLSSNQIHTNQLPQSSTPITNPTNTPGILAKQNSKLSNNNNIIINNNNNNNQSLDLEVDEINQSFEIPRENRSRSPSVYFDQPISTTLIYQQQTTNNNPQTNSKPKGKLDKFRPRLHLPLGRLGKQNTVDATTAPETGRIREDHSIHVRNPTFTHENLRQQNYDAFFQSGEPVYSIEKRAPSQPPPDPEPPPLPQHTLTPAELNHKPPTNLSNNTSYFRRAKSPSLTRQFTTSTRPLTPATPTPSRVTKSVEFEERRATSVEPYQKGSLKSHRSIFGWKGSLRNSLGSSHRGKMASSSGILKDLCHSNYNESLKLHNGVTFKLIKTVSDFTDTLAQLYEQHAEALQLLVSSYRKKNGELRKERPACHSTLFQAWETFLQEIEADSQSTSDVASSLSRQVARPLLERSFYRKVQSRKVFTHRESFDTIIAKTEEKLSKCRLDYKQCHMTHRQNPTQQTLTLYIDSHNAYVQQLHATNAMLEFYHCDTVPNLLQELEEIYSDLCNIVSEAVIQGAEAISHKALEQAKRYDGLAASCKAVSGQQDLSNLVRVLPVTPNANRVPKKVFAPAQPPPVNAEGKEITDYNDPTPLFKNELVIERGASIQPRQSIESLKREVQDLEIQIRQLQDSIDALARTQTRGIDSQLYNKANEIQEDISMKKFDLRAKQIHLAAVKAQKELFLGKSELGSPLSERKLSSSSSSSMKTKWLKAFRSLKPTSAAPTENPIQSVRPTNQMYHAVSTVLTMNRKNGAAAAAALAQIRAGDTESHNLQEYTYKKITPCDVCGKVLRGHVHQGLRCRICKTNAHPECAPQLSRCQAKQKLLRRQKSTSEIENRIDPDEEREGPSLLSRHLSREPCDLEITEVDQIYKVLKQAGEITSKTTEKSATNNFSSLVAAVTSQQREKEREREREREQQQQIQPPDIPVVNVPPECPPDRIAPRRGQLRPQGGIGGGGANQKNSGLTAPPSNDVSCSDYRLQLAMMQGGYVSGMPVPSTASTTTAMVDTGTRRRLFAGFRPLSQFGRFRIRSTQHRSVSLPETPHSPRRHKLNLRMKSLSLDSPESSELHGQMRRRQPPGPSGYHGGSGGALEHSCTPPSNNSRLQSPSSPSHQRKLLYANRGLRTGSVDLPDEMEKSLSSASTSPCPSPVRQNQKPHRLLPTNLYVILYNFKARQKDELDLKAGYKVTVIDTSDPDWWKGKCLGRIGYFPSKYCTRLAAGEKPLQVTLNLTVSDGERTDGSLKLLRDQIVIQVGEEVGAMVMVRTADNRQGICPIKYLQEV